MADFLLTHSIMLLPLVVVLGPPFVAYFLWEHLANKGKDIMDKNHCSKPQTSILKTEK